MKQTRGKHKMLAIIGKILLSILAIIIVLVIVLFLRGKWKSSQPFLKPGYAASYHTDAALEAKYLGMGPHPVSSEEYDAQDEKIIQYKVWYPTGLERSSRIWPMVLIVNASDTNATRYEPFFEHLASWGFIVVGNEDRMTGTGASCGVTMDKMLALNEQDSLLHGKIDVNNIGIAGFSQGGAGAINAVIDETHGHWYKTLFTGSAANSTLSEAIGWAYDASKVSIPWFMDAGTLKGDTGENGGIGVAPLSSLIENFDAAADGVLKVRARAVGADHEDMLIRSDGYLVAWMLFQLQGDQEAAQAFVGDHPELMNNARWQDVMISE